MKNFKIKHDKGRNWYGMTCVRCEVISVMFFSKGDAIRWGDVHLRNAHRGDRGSPSPPRRVLVQGQK